MEATSRGEAGEGRPPWQIRQINVHHDAYYFKVLSLTRLRVSDLRPSVRPTSVDVTDARKQQSSATAVVRWNGWVGPHLPKSKFKPHHEMVVAQFLVRALRPHYFAGATISTDRGWASG